MSKNKQKFTIEDFEKGLMLAGYLNPKNEQELLERESLEEYENANKPSNIYFKRAVLAAEIVSELHDEITFGRVKFQKLVYLCENAGKMNLNNRYKKFAAGPFDNKFMHSITKVFKEQKWFEDRKVQNNGFSRTIYMPLENSGNHRRYYNNYFGTEDDNIKFLINTFRRSNTRKVELVATIYFCLDELMSNNKEFEELSFFDIFYSWSKEKKKFSQPEIREEIRWMRNNNLTPESILK